MNRIRVLIVEDSAVVRGLLEHIIGMDSRLEVAGSAESGEQALRFLASVTPDVIAMDVGLPGIDGLETTRRIMTQMPIPVVVVTARGDWRDQSFAVAEAMQAGALAVLEKPAGTTSIDYQILSERLCTQLVIMSEVKLVRRYGRRARTSVKSSGKPHSFSMLGIASSTGGPEALMKLLGGLGSDFPLPVLLVQHMAASFLEGFAAWLASVCPFQVVIANHDSIPTPQTLHLAPADQHLCLSGGRLRLNSAAPVCAQRPSGNILFRSMASCLGSDAIGVLLTGMGQDGASGLYDIRQAGGHTIAQNEATCAVYGMPAAAVAMGAACETLPLEAIAPRVRELTLQGLEV